VNSPCCSLVVHCHSLRLRSVPGWYPARPAAKHARAVCRAEVGRVCFAGWPVDRARAPKPCSSTRHGLRRPAADRQAVFKKASSPSGGVRSVSSQVSFLDSGPTLAPRFRLAVPKSNRTPRISCERRLSEDARTKRRRAAPRPCAPPARTADRARSAARQLHPLVRRHPSVPSGEPSSKEA
jgi:hypothetical protein